jgi:hypothetical protein
MRGASLRTSGERNITDLKNLSWDDRYMWLRKAFIVELGD